MVPRNTLVMRCRYEIAWYDMVPLYGAIWVDNIVYRMTWNDATRHDMPRRDDTGWNGTRHVTDTQKKVSIPIHHIRVSYGHSHRESFFPIFSTFFSSKFFNLPNFPGGVFSYMKFNKLDFFGSGEFHQQWQNASVHWYISSIISKLWKTWKKRSPIRTSLKTGVTYVAGSPPYYGSRLHCLSREAFRPTFPRARTTSRRIALTSHPRYTRSQQLVPFYWKQERSTHSARWDLNSPNQRGQEMFLKIIACPTLESNSRVSTGPQQCGVPATILIRRDWYGTKGYLIPVLYTWYQVPVTRYYDLIYAYCTDRIDTRVWWYDVEWWVIPVPGIIDHD